MYMFKGSDELQYKNKYISVYTDVVKMPKEKRIISGVANSEMQTSPRHRLNWNHF